MRWGSPPLASVPPEGCLVWREHELASYLLLFPSLSFCLPLPLRLSVLLLQGDGKAQEEARVAKRCAMHGLQAIDGLPGALVDICVHSLERSKCSHCQMDIMRA